MKTAILTQPLLANYGCLLQNYALQQALRRLGHDPVTLDYLPVTYAKWYLKSLWRKVFRGAPYVPLLPGRPPVFDRFVRERITTLPQRGCYRHASLEKNGIDALVVGSDQVWRPRFNRKTLPDMFFAFAGDFQGPRIAYAASFGTEEWDGDAAVTARCATLLRRFDAVSVREPSGVELCRRVFGVDAVQMPDPLLLLEKEGYLSLCEAVPAAPEPYVAAYVLDAAPESEERVAAKSAETGLKVRRATSGPEAALTVEEWIAFFRDASAVVTDSFHGAVLSRLLGKPCEVVENADRGRGRYAVLDGLGDWAALRKQGLDYLQKALSGISGGGCAGR